MLEVQQFNHVSVVGLQGELSRRNVHVLDEVLSSLAKCEQRNVVLDMAALEHLDYRLVKRIAERIVEFQCDGGDLKMAAASGYVGSILRVMGLDEVIYPSLAEALLSFVGGDVPDGDPL